MVRRDTRKFVLMISFGVVLFILCAAVVFVIDTHFSLSPWGDEDATMLFYFVCGCIFFPGAFRRYKAGRKAEIKISWYRRPDFILCLVGLVSGLIFALSVLQKWVEYVLLHDDFVPFPLGRNFFTAEAIAIAVTYLSWLALLILFIYQGVKQKRNNRKEPPSNGLPS
jgi:hypothetical protein